MTRMYFKKSNGITPIIDWMNSKKYFSEEEKTRLINEAKRLIEKDQFNELLLITGGVNGYDVYSINRLSAPADVLNTLCPSEFLLTNLC